MIGVGKTGAGKPKVRPGGFDGALEVIVAVRGDESTREYLTELVAATAEHDKARTEAETAIAEAKRRDATAREAEASARTQREFLASQTEAANNGLREAKREQDIERQRLAEWAKELEGKDSDITMRESALQRAFAAYQGE